MIGDDTISGRVFSIKKIKIKRISSENKLQYFLTLIFIVGIVFGCVAFYKSDRAFSIAKYLFSNLLSKKINANFGNLFLFSILNGTLVSIVFFTLGTSLFGTVFLPIIYLVLGTVTGGMLSCAYYKYSLKGIAFNAIILIPPLLFFVLGMLIVSRVYFDFSLSISKSTFKNNISSQANKIDFTIIWKKIGLQVLFIIISAIIDTILSRFFIKLFNF